MAREPLTSSAAEGGSGFGAVARWGIAAAAIVSAHVALAMAVLDQTPKPTPAGAEQAPILIDLAPPAAAPQIASVEAPTGPEVIEEEVEEPTPEPVPEPPAPEPEPEPVVEPLPEPEPEPVVEPEPEPELVEPEPEPEEPEPEVAELPEPQPEAEAVLNVPMPTARPNPPPRRVREEPRREEPRRQARREEPQRAEPQRRQQRQAPPPSAASQGQSQRQASQGARSNSVSPARWQSQVQARLNRAKRTPRGAGRGTVSVSFTISASGSAGGVRIARSSGNATLDQAAVQLVQRASPFPAPPSGGSVSLTVPIRYD
ncbi:energy transducer TonB [Aureimonas mangrovi]|uniref:energy transducer TonB n=1 Tax=Aureimonas mangrovi TaxID=2758041 RepID=UPI00163DA37A|nr:energy transducer TonB [Aureimonas mangrovi]